MKCTVNILNINPKKAKLGLFKIGEAEVLRFKRIITLDIDEGMFDTLLPLLDEQLIEVYIKGGIIRKATRLNEIPKIIIDSYSLIKALVKDEGGKLSKKKFYELYVKEVNCVKRTAENHLKQALASGIIQESDYYNLCLPNSTRVIKSVKEESEDDRRRSNPDEWRGRREQRKDRWNYFKTFRLREPVLNRPFKENDMPNTQSSYEKRKI